MKKRVVFIVMLAIATIATADQSGATYVNVHTDKHPGGEIRGQIRE